MRLTSFRQHVSLLAIIGGCTAASAAPTTEGPNHARQRVQAWTEDLAYLVAEVTARHPNPEHAVTRAVLLEAAASLESRLPELHDHAVIVEMARLTALIGDAHTYVDLPTKGPYRFRRLPVRLAWFADGIHVVAAGKPQAGLVGGRLLKINGMPIEEVTARVRTAVSIDNEMTARFLVPRRIVIPELLHAVGVLPDPSAATLTVQAENGPHTAQIVPVDADEEVDWIDGRPASDDESALFWADTEREYWFRYLPDRRTLYLQFNSVRQRANEPMDAFARRLHRFIETNPVQCLIIDLRRNIGGDWRIAVPLIREIVKSGRFETEGSLVTLIGRSSISATVVFALELQRYTANLFVGEPSGGCANQYGENRFLTLPNSKIQVSYATRFFQTAGPVSEANARWITPDIAIDLSSTDYFMGQDPVLSAALNYQPGQTLRQQVTEALSAGGIDNATRVYHAYKGDARHRWVDTERSIRHLADALLEQGDADHALILFDLNMSSYPRRATAHLGAAFACRKVGQSDKANALLKQALALLPDDASLNRYDRRRLEHLIRQALSEPEP